MDKELLKKAAMQSIALMVAVVTLSFAVQQYRTITIEASNITKEDSFLQDSSELLENATLPENNKDHEGKNLELTPTYSINSDKQLTKAEDLKDIVDESILNKLSQKFIIIKKPQGKDITLKIEDLYLTQSINIMLEGLTDNTISSQMIYRVGGKDFYIGDPVYSEIINTVFDDDKSTSSEVHTKDYGNDFVHGITISLDKSTTNQGNTANLLLQLDNVYAHIVYEDERYYYIDLRKPTEIYDKIVVIDPGHGGKDAGAISRNDKFYEKNINLEIAMRLKKLLDQTNIKVYYTRTVDSTVYLRPRVQLANMVDADYFISIHCNSNGLTSPNGSEVLYYENKFKGVAAADLAHLFSEEMGKKVTLRNRGIVKKHMEDIYIMDKAVVPMILIEVGYLSNTNDMNYLLNEENQEAVAQGIYNGILKAYKELPVTK
jgi:N-acetylmuramoyl-L-alanine amidase